MQKLYQEKIVYKKETSTTHLKKRNKAKKNAETINQLLRYTFWWLRKSIKYKNNILSNNFSNNFAEEIVFKEKRDFNEKDKPPMDK